MNSIELFHYWRSSSSWRVRATLALKQIPYRATHISLLNDDTESPEYLAKNPIGTVPTLKVNDSDYLIESLAILRYLDVLKPTPGFWTGHHSDRSATPVDEAKVGALCEIINSGTHPIQNLPVLHYLSKEPFEQKKWAHHWIQNGLAQFEKLLSFYGAATHFCYGNTLTAADICLVPQVYNALRYDVDITTFPLIHRIHRHLLSLDCFLVSHPDLFKPKD